MPYVGSFMGKPTPGQLFLSNYRYSTPWLSKLTANGPAFFCHSNVEHERRAEHDLFALPTRWLRVGF
jgi:hypothetical protein